MSLWLFMIVLHALAGLIAFCAGLYVIRPHNTRKLRAIFMLYQLSLGGLVLFMTLAMAAHWREISGPEKSIYSFLVLLGIYMTYRAWHAGQLLRMPAMDARRYIDNIGFTLIALFDGFVIVAAIDLGAPAWLVAVGAVVAVIIGNRLLDQEKAHAELRGQQPRW